MDSWKGPNGICGNYNWEDADNLPNGCFVWKGYVRWTGAHGEGGGSNGECGASHRQCICQKTTEETTPQVQNTGLLLEAPYKNPKDFNFNAIRGRKATCKDDPNWFPVSNRSPMKRDFTPTWYDWDGERSKWRRHQGTLYIAKLLYRCRPAYHNLHT
jgi:hypothetical protein